MRSFLLRPGESKVGDGFLPRGHWLIMIPTDSVTDSVLGPPTGALELRIRGGSRDGQVARMRSSKWTLGSSKSCSLQLQRPGVHPIHCLILRGRGGAVIRRWSPDTRLNGQIFDDAVLKNGDRLSVGPVEFDVSIEGEAQPQALSSPPTAETIPLQTPSHHDENRDELETKLGAMQQQLSDNRRAGHRRSRRLIGLVRDARKREDEIVEQNELSLKSDHDALKNEQRECQQRLDQRERELSERETEVQQRGERLDDQEDAIDARERAIAESDQILQIRANRLDVDIERQREQQEEQFEHVKQQGDQQEQQREQYQLELAEQRLALQQERAALETDRSEFEELRTLNEQEASIEVPEDPVDLPAPDDEASTVEGACSEEEADTDEEEVDTDEEEIHFDPASPEPPMSSADVFARLGLEMPEEDSHDSGQSTSDAWSELSSPTMAASSESRKESSFDVLDSLDQSSTQPSPTGGLSSATEDEEESIEDYMARLMVRVRGEVEEAEANAGIMKPRPIASHSGPPMSNAPTNSPALAEPQVDEVSGESSESGQDSQPEAYLPHASAPENVSNLAAMRDLANASARSHITQSTKSHCGQAALGKLAMALVSLVAGIALTLWAPQLRSLPFLGACFGFVAASYWLMQSAILARNLLTAERLGEGAPFDDEE